MDSITPSTIASVVSLVTPLLLVLVVVFVAYYTRSRHILLRRIWQLLHGTEEIKDSLIRKFVDDQSSLIGFRLYSGVATKNLHDTRQLLVWAETNGVEMERLRRCGRYFDPKTRTVLVSALPNRLTRVWQAATVLVFALLTVISTVAIGPNQVLFSFKETRRLFFATPTEARPLWPWSAGVLRSSDCLQRPIDQPMQSPFSQRETEVTCGIFAAPETPGFMKQQLSIQRSTLVSFILVFVFLIFFRVRVLSQAYAARDLLMQRLDPDLENGQMSLDLRE